MNLRKCKKHFVFLILMFILPEMFHAGFTMSPEKVSEKMEGELVKWLKSSAIKYNVTIIGVNRVGVDNLNSYVGNSMVIDANGEIILT